MKRSSRVIVGFMMLLLAAVAARVYASLPFGGDDGGFVPPDKNTAKCEDAVAKSLAHFLSCVLICHAKAANAALASQTFNEEMCEDGPAANGNSCLEKYQAAANKLLNKAICPPCLDITAMMSLTTQGETLLDNLNQVIYCGGAAATPTPTNTPAPTNTPTCPVGQTNCGGTCVDTNTDVNNCKACGHVCPSVANGTAACTNGTCGIGSCNAGFADCDNNPANGCETNISSNVNDCGTCGHVCSLPNATAGCTNGSCTVASCNAGFADCDNSPANGCETNISSNVNDCGTCGHVCSLPNATAGCTNGSCTVASCNAGFADCDNNPANGCETNTSSNVNNCGGCGIVCSAPNATSGCSSGICTVASCAAGFANCDGITANGCEINLTNNSNNCGSCGNQCATTSSSTCGTTGTCSASVCQFWVSGTTCAAQSCTGSTETLTSTCNGSGTCVAGATVNCAPYVCGAGACKTSCSSNADCVSATCSFGVCS